MLFYSFEMFLVGIILFSGMIAAGVKIWIKQKQNNLEKSPLQDDQKTNL